MPYKPIDTRVAEAVVLFCMTSAEIVVDSYERNRRATNLENSHIMLSGTKAKVEVREKAHR